ncbi:MAG: replication-relaxation family protein [Hyphomicrobiaceae bacterium]
MKRFTRSANPGGFEFQERDWHILAGLGTWGYMSMPQIVRHTGDDRDDWQESPVCVRVRKMWHLGFVDRPPVQAVQLAALAYNGSVPLVYGLTRHGADLISAKGYTLSHVDCTAANKRAVNLPHTLQTTGTMVDFHKACAARGFHIAEQHALLPYMPTETRELAHRPRKEGWKDPFRLRVTVRPGDVPHLKLKATTNLVVVPDRLFSIFISANERHNHPLEIDRGKMRHKKFKEKLTAYFCAWLFGRHTEQWGFERYRVLIVTPSETRIANMLDEQHAITEGRASQMFLYTTPALLQEHGPLGPAWKSAESDGIALMDRA